MHTAALERSQTNTERERDRAPPCVYFWMNEPGSKKFNDNASGKQGSRPTTYLDSQS